MSEDLIEKREWCTIACRKLRSPNIKASEFVRLSELYIEQMGWKPARPRGRGESEKAKLAGLAELGI